MSDIQDKINQILNNPEALKQVQSLGEQLGLSSQAQQRMPIPKASVQSEPIGDDIMNTLVRLAPMMKSMKNDDDTSRLLNSLRPFLSHEKQAKLDRAEKMLKFFKIIPMLKDNGLFI